MCKFRRPKFSVEHIIIVTAIIELIVVLIQLILILKSGQ